MKSLLTAVLIAIVVSGFSIAGIMRFSLAQDPPLLTISGYILDSDGHGIGGANIIFNVPNIVPIVHSDSSGYYGVSAPAGTYHINVWPPFDSNYINYDEPGFVVGSDISKNITLASGCKVSGYITDSSGAPVIGASVLFRDSVNTFGSGWFSNNAGYYFLSVHAGTYTIDAHPRTAYGGYSYSGVTTEFPTYYEYNFVVSGNIVKNITVGGTSPTPSSTGNVTNSDSNSWPMFHKDLAHSGYSGSTGPLTNQILWKFQTGSSVESSPAVVDDVVYFGALLKGHNGFVYAVNATTGSKIWQFATDSGVESSPAVVDGVVYIGSYGGNVFALNAVSGSKIWSFNAGGSVFPSPAVVGGTVYVGSDSDNLYALNAASGSPLWSYHTGGGISSSPAVVDGVVYFGSQDQNIYALRASDGSEIWHYTTGSFVDTSPAVVGGIVYFGSRDGYVYALNAATGSKIWAFHSTRAPITGRAYYYSTPAVAKGIVYFGMYDNYVYALNAADGSLFWEFQTGNYVFSSPVVAGEVVYVGSFDNNVYALNAMTGSKIWSYQTGDQMRSSAAVVNGVVYVGSGDGYLYAFGSNNVTDITVESSSTPSPSQSPSPSPSPTTPSQPTLELSCKSSTSYSGFNVEIEGNLSFNGTAIPDATILLSYSVNGGKSWEDLTLVYTGPDGSYYATWLPFVTGNYLVKAVYEGNAGTLGAASEIVNLAVTKSAEKKPLFSVSSNSTITSLAFNSTTLELNFKASGPSGTTGYVQVTIAKSLVANPENIKVYLDGNQLNYEVTSNAGSWLLYFTYTHSTNHVSINLAMNNSGTPLSGIEYWTWIVVAIIMVVISISLLVYFKKRKRKTEVYLIFQPPYLNFNFC